MPFGQKNVASEIGEKVHSKLSCTVAVGGGSKGCTEVGDFNVNKQKNNCE